MSYYKPVFFVVISFIVSVFSSASFPIMGLVYARFKNIMTEFELETFEEDRNLWCVYWMLITVAIGLLVATERSLFGIMGESLIFKVRKELIRGVIYK
jgi:hypothetical protein